MKTKEGLIKELSGFVASLRNDGMADRHEVQGVVIMVYSPNDLGSDDDMWHNIMNTYSSKSEAMDRYANTSETDSLVVLWDDSMSWSDLLDKLDISISNMINRIFILS